jgi:NAD(P)-dependent dehydrogenase (short-subunit alcohol dehydrogenase family)
MSTSRPTALITGASRGIGRAIALRLSTSHDIIALARSTQELDALATEIAGRGGRCRAIPVDVTDSVAVGEALRGVDVDVLVNNAGIAPTEPVDSWDAAEESWDRVLRVNLKSVYLCSRAAIPTMLDKGQGVVVNIASIAATRAVSCASYAAAKAGILGYTHQVAAELAPRGVRVNCVSPGYMRTPMSTGERWGLDAAQQEQRVAALGERAPMKRMGSVDDIAAAVVYLASDDARYVTGQEIVVDGGYLVG